MGRFKQLQATFPKRHPDQHEQKRRTHPPKAENLNMPSHHNKTQLTPEPLHPPNLNLKYPATPNARPEVRSPPNPEPSIRRPLNPKPSKTAPSDRGCQFGPAHRVSRARRVRLRLGDLGARPIFFLFLSVSWAWFLVLPLSFDWLQFSSFLRFWVSFSFSAGRCGQYGCKLEAFEASGRMGVAANIH